MSTFNKVTKHPETGKMEEAVWLDDHFGRHKYGVQFPDGKIFPEDQVEYVEEEGSDEDTDDSDEELVEPDTI